MWSVWPFLDGLCDFLRQTPVRSADQVSWISKEAVLIRRGSDRTLSVWRILVQVARHGIAVGLRRHWAAALLVLTLVLGAALVPAGVFGGREFALALALPILLVFVQELWSRGQPP